MIPTLLKTHSTKAVLAGSVSVLLASLKSLGKSTPWQDQNFIGSSHNSEYEWMFPSDKTDRLHHLLIMADFLGNQKFD